MNPNTHITPLLGVFMMKLNRDTSSLPIYFILQRNVRNFDMASLEFDDLTFGFDIKGQV